MRAFHLGISAILLCALALCVSCEDSGSAPADSGAITPVQADPEPVRGDQDDDPQSDDNEDPQYTLTRVCSFNAEDLRYDDILAALRGAENAPADRARHAARLLAALDPDVLLVNELEFDYISAEPLSGRAFADLLRQQRAFLGLPDREYAVYQQPSNTGLPSSHDLDRDGQIVSEPGSGAYAADSLGYGEFPGHYAMALFVAQPLTIDSENARTFRSFLWKDMPDALLPPGDGERVPESEPWYTAEMLQDLPLSSKSHWDIPIRSSEGSVFRILASHPTPPVFDGPEDRNGRRNHDEIRFWAEYLSGADWIVDDQGAPAGAPEEPVIIMGDLNADPKAGDSRDNPVATWLLNHPMLNGYFIPHSTVEIESRGRPLRSDATAEFGLRVDYTIPSKGILVVRGGIVRGEADLPAHPDHPEEALRTIEYDVSDHFPVWLDIRLPGDTE